MSTFKPQAVETIVRAGRKTVYRVRWINPLDGRTYPYSKLADVDDGEDFRSWLVSKGGRVTATTPEVVQGTWRGGNVETVFGDTRITFGTFARRQIDGRTLKDGSPISERTKAQLQSQLKNYFGELDGVRMIDIDEETVKRVLASLRAPREIVVSKKGSTRTVKLAASTVVHYSWFFWGIFTAAVKAGTISRHPFGGIELPKPEDAHRRLTEDEFCLSVDNYGALMSAAAEMDAQTFELLRLILHTGLRIGEALALQVRHLDFESGRVLVRQQLRKGGTGKDATKSVKGSTELERSTSERNVPVEPTALSGLHAWLVRNGIVGNPNAFVFARPRSVRHSSPWAYEAWHRGRWSRVLQLAKDEFGMPKRNSKGVEFNTTPHCLRHTFASRMLNARTADGGRLMSVLDVSTLLGHKDTKVTERIYLHTVGSDLDDRAKEAAALAFAMPTASATILRNGWYVTADGTKKRRTSSAA